jgi:hypothetical protein
MGWMVRGSNPGGGAIFSAPVQTSPAALKAYYRVNFTLSLPFHINWPNNLGMRAVDRNAGKETFANTQFLFRIKQST